MSVAIAHWASFNGWCHTHGVKPLEIDLADLCDVTYYWLTRNADEEEKAKIDETLSTAPQGVTGVRAGGDDYEAPGWSVEDQMDAWAAF